MQARLQWRGRAGFSPASQKHQTRCLIRQADGIVKLHCRVGAPSSGGRSPDFAFLSELPSKAATISCMTATDILLLHFEEVRRRSLIVWRRIPSDRAHWKPDGQAMTCIEMVRHVLEGEFLYTEMLKARRSVGEHATPFSERPFTTIENEIEFAIPHRAALLDLVRSFRSEELNTVMIDRSDKGYVRAAGDFLLRMSYHEAVHTGQLLAYLRAMDVPRPNIWD